MAKHTDSSDSDDEIDPADAETVVRGRPISPGEAPTVEFSYVESTSFDSKRGQPEGMTEQNKIAPQEEGPPKRRETLVSLWVVFLLLMIVAAVLFRYRGAMYADIYDPEAVSRAVTPRGELSSLELTQVEIFKAASPSVVHIMTQAGERHLGIGTGFVWSEKGYIVTNNHVLKGAENAFVTLSNNQTFAAVLVGRDPSVDIAVLKIPAEKGDLTAIAVGESATLQVGQSVYAIGSPFGLDQTLTSGIISGLGRKIDPDRGVTIHDAIQTDAAINRGNSGGPLLDSAGRLIGINVMIVSESGANSGVGFAVPVDTVNRVVPELVRKGVFERPALGVRIYRDDQLEALQLRGVEIGHGALIIDTLPGSSASRAGLRGEKAIPGKGLVLGDLIIGIDDVVIQSSTHLQAVLAKRKVGDTVVVKYMREGIEQSVE
ncbi:MAG: trypsin-like peptidase domain-containing protein, partial [Planctomycetaceae bacterium]